MDENREAAIAQLKRILLRGVDDLCKKTNRAWSKPIVQTLKEIQSTNTHAVFFGGTLRSLLVARVLEGKLGRPRDIDLVIEGASVESLRKQFDKYIARETRFGGLQLQRKNWQFDVWPLHRTWAFTQGSIPNPEFSSLPSTTFFNLEAIAVDVWPFDGKERTIYSGNDQFFDGILTRTLEINYEENPFPTLCVVRALLMASSLDFKIGPRLAQYLAIHGPKAHDDELETIQRKHYGQLRQESRILREWINIIKCRNDQDATASIKLPIPRQLGLWSNVGKPEQRLKLLMLGMNAKQTGQKK